MGCGAPSGENQLAAEQSQFYKDLTKEYGTMYAEDANIRGALTRSLEPIVAAGPGQEGYSPTELASLNTTARQGVGDTYAHAKAALQTTLGAQGGGNDPNVTSGASGQLNEELLSGAAKESSNEQLGIRTRSAEVGRENYFAAEHALGGVPGETEGPLAGLGGAATGAGSSANETYKDIASANNAWMGALGGALGGIGGAVAGGWANNHL